MGFRDDRDALLHRADALQRDLEQAREDQEASEERIAALERELAEARRERDRLREKVGEPEPGPEPEPEPEPNPEPEPDTSLEASVSRLDAAGVAKVMVLVGVLAAFAVIVVVSC